MLDSAAQEALAQRVVALSPAAQTEVTVSSEDFGLTRFARNAIVRARLAYDVAKTELVEKDGHALDVLIVGSGPAPGRSTTMRRR